MTNKDFSKLSPELIVLIRKSTHDPFLGDIALQKNPKDIVAIHHGLTIVGFAIPRKDGDGYWRTGPIFIDPLYRNKGYGGEWVKEFFKGRKGRAYINPTNTPSKALFMSAGFKETSKSIMDGGEKLIQFLKEKWYEGNNNKR